ncbi:hypothetical protein ASG60_18300 [Methylobacterium sp. Leaf469]|nr:hypothetical protein ASG60_18300 [Methylobacterium sp. Leaf469]
MPVEVGCEDKEVGSGSLPMPDREIGKEMKPPELLQHHGTQRRRVGVAMEGNLTTGFVVTRPMTGSRPRDLGVFHLDEEGCGLAVGGDDG